MTEPDDLMTLATPYALHALTQAEYDEIERQRAAAPELVARAFDDEVRAVWEAVNNGWNQWVLNYSQSRQFDLLKALGFESPSWQDLSTVLGILFVIAASGGGLWTLWERSQHDPWLRLLARVRQRLAKAGLPLPETLPPRSMAQQVTAHFGDSASGVAAWLLRLEQVRYAPEPAQQFGALRREFNTLPWPPSARGR